MPKRITRTLMAPIRDPNREIAGLSSGLSGEGLLIEPAVGPESHWSTQPVQKEASAAEPGKIDGVPTGSTCGNYAPEFLRDWDVTAFWRRGRGQAGIGVLALDAFRATTPLLPPTIPVASAARPGALPRSNRVLSKPADASPVRSGWPATPRLVEQLQELRLGRSAAASEWARRVGDKLSELGALPRLSDQRGEQILADLDRLAITGLAKAEAIDDRDPQIAWLTAAHAVARRVAVWQPIWAVSEGGGVSVLVGSLSIEPTPPSLSLDAAIARVRSDLNATGDIQGWARFLMLDELAATAPESRVRVLVCQRLLSRLNWYGLTADQAAWIDRESVRNLAAVVRPHAGGAVDYAELLRQLERQESDAIDLAAIRIAEAAQTLRFSDPAGTDSRVLVNSRGNAYPRGGAGAVAGGLNRYYRNANIRTAISAALINRLMPAVDAQTEPIRTTLAGSRVRGISRVESDVRLALIPTKDRWRLTLLTLGDVRTESVGAQRGVRVRTAGYSRFTAAADVEIDPAGVLVGEPSVSVDGSTRLRGIDTDFDGWPIVGGLVRSIAKDRYRDVAPQAKRISERRIGDEVSATVEDRLKESIAKATTQLTGNVMGPLGSLQLQPQVTDMKTTPERLLARYRLAGDWQLAAFTPRPRAPGDSLMSLQVHQSAVNNTLEQLVPRDRPMSILDVVRRGARLFGQDLSELEDLPDDVEIQFATTRPITVEVDEDGVWVTLRIMRLQRGRRLNLTRFIVRAQYEPVVDGLKASLVRNGHLRISGPGMSMRERLPVRAIFNKVLSPNRGIPLTLPALTEHPALARSVISQLELRDGWLAIAISDDDPEKVATYIGDLKR